MEWIKIENINPQTERPFGCQTYWASPNDHLGKRIK